MHHGTVDAVRRQVLHGEHVLPEGVLLHLPHGGLLAMRALTLTRRLTRAPDVPLSSGDRVPLLCMVDLHRGLPASCVVLGVSCVQAHCRLLLS